MSNILKTSIPAMTALVAIIAFTFSTTASAELDGAKLFTDKTCHSCHGKDANTPLMPNYPSIGGQSAEYLALQMKDIKSGKRSNGQSAAMKGVMHLISDEEIDAIAKHLATLEYKPGKSSAKKVEKKAEPAKAKPTTASPHGAKAKHDGTNEKVWMTSGGEREVAMDLKPDNANGIEVYEVCAACHLTEGWGKPDGTFPQLAGQHRSVLIKQLADIRSKNRDNPTMYPFALPESIGDEQAMADVTAYITKIPMNPDNGKGKWDESTPEFTQGKKLYDTNCVECHGKMGEGNAEKFFPLIQGQHYNYMLRQFEWIRDGKRRNANPDMVKQIKTFSDKDMEMVINYVSRIKVPKEKLAPSKEWLNPDYD
ncbi:MAG: cytochrome c4 [Thiotrichaceae bacterium]|nr:cytochrome c4 [Thiotrichaceae bacterium]